VEVSIHAVAPESIGVLSAANKPVALAINRSTINTVLFPEIFIS
jgi:hypothetical protein